MVPQKASSLSSNILCCSSFTGTSRYTTELMAGQQLPVPEPMQCTGDVATNWKVFQKAYADYAIHGYRTGKEKEGSTSGHSEDSNGKEMLANTRAT